MVDYFSVATVLLDNDTYTVKEIVISFLNGATLHALVHVHTGILVNAHSRIFTDRKKIQFGDGQES